MSVVFISVIGAISETSQSVVTIREEQSVTELSDKITQVQQSAEETGDDANEGDLVDYPRGDSFKLTLNNNSVNDVSRILTFSHPLLMKARFWGGSESEPHVDGLRVGEGVGTVDFVADAGGRDYGTAQISIPAGGKLTLEFGHEGRISQSGIFLWKPEALAEFRQYRTWTDGIFLGVISVLLAFSAGAALFEWSRLSFARLGFIASAWFLEFTTLGDSQAMLGGGALSPVWTAIALSVLGLAGVGFLRTIVEFLSGTVLRSRILQLVFGVLILTLLVSLMGFSIGGLLSRLAITLLALSTIYLLFRADREGGLVDRSALPGITVLIVTGVLVVLLPLLPWGATGLILDPLVHGLFLVSLGLVVFPAAVRDVAEAGSVNVAPELPPETAPSPPQRQSSLQNEDRYALGVAGAHQGLWDWIVEGDRLYLSPTIDGMLGLPVGSLERSEEAWAARIHPEDLETYRSALRSYLERGNISFNLEFRVRHENATYRWFQLRATCLPGDDGYAVRCVGVVSDISPTKAAEERMMQSATLDGLTGLANRARLLEVLSESLKLSAEHPAASPALLVVDLDRFKTINDGLGHAMGDKLLCLVAEKIETTIGPSDVAARIGSDEFAILLCEGTVETEATAGQPGEGPGAEELSEYLLDLLAQPVDLDEHEVFPRASIGVAHGRDWHETAEDLLKDAEIAMLRAKREGGGRLVVFHPKMRSSTHEALSLETDLRHALARQQIEILFQPIMDLQDGRIAGFEALMRWRHPSKGLLSPDQFMSLAEETDMIVPLGRFALSMASLQLGHWQSTFPLNRPLFVSVNVSSRQLKREDFAADVSDVLESAKLAPGTLRLEVTESLIMEDPELAEKLLRQVRELGAGVSLDDFGTGFASLSNLQKYPFDSVKVDRSFISTMESRDDSSVIVNSIVDLANDLDLVVIAEGLESEDDALHLRQMGCRYGQGYVFGAPMSASDAQTFIAHHWKQ